jgi:hypothetical protein
MEVGGYKEDLQNCTKAFVMRDKLRDAMARQGLEEGSMRPRTKLYIDLIDDDVDVTARTSHHKCLIRDRQ